MEQLNCHHYRNVIKITEKLTHKNNFNFNILRPLLTSSAFLLHGSLKIKNLRCLEILKKNFLNILKT